MPVQFQRTIPRPTWGSHDPPPTQTPPSKQQQPTPTQETILSPWERALQTPTATSSYVSQIPAAVSVGGTIAIPKSQSLTTGRIVSINTQFSFKPLISFGIMLLVIIIPVIILIYDSISNWSLPIPIPPSMKTTIDHFLLSSNVPLPAITILRISYEKILEQPSITQQTSITITNNPLKKIIISGSITPDRQNSDLNITKQYSDQHEYQTSQFRIAKKGWYGMNNNQWYSLTPADFETNPGETSFVQIRQTKIKSLTTQTISKLLAGFEVDNKHDFSSTYFVIKGTIEYQTLANYMQSLSSMYKEYTTLPYLLEDANRINEHFSTHAVNNPINIEILISKQSYLPEHIQINATQEENTYEITFDLTNTQTIGIQEIPDTPTAFSPDNIHTFSNSPTTAALINLFAHQL